MNLKRLSTFAEEDFLFEGLSVPDVPEEKLVPQIKTRREERDTYEKRKEELVEIYFNSQTNLSLLLDTRDQTIPVYEILKEALIDMLKESGFVESNYGQKLKLRIEEWERSADEIKSAGDLLKMFNNVMMILGGYRDNPINPRRAHLLSSLLKMADKLDREGKTSEANVIDTFVKEGSFEEYIRGLANREGIPEDEALEMILNHLKNETVTVPLTPSPE